MSTTAQRAQAAIYALLFRYNPRQPRGGDGRWTDGPGGGLADLTRANVDLSDSDREFLSDYVEDGRSYREINDALRGQRELTPEMADKIERLDRLAAGAELDGDATFYRAMSVRITDPLMRQIVSGEGTITDPGYGSVSGDRDAVEDFKGTTDNTVVFEIQARRGDPVLVLGDDLSDSAMMQTPQEALLPRGYRLRIDKVSNRRRNGQMVWTVQAIYEGADPPQAITAAFNPHQRRGPDGRWIKMPTYLRKERRRERDRKRREDKRVERDGGKAAQPWRDTEMPISELLDIAMVNRLDPASPKIQALADDIRKNGITRRLQVEDSPKGLFLGDGHHRLLAAREAGLDKVPVRIFDASPEGRRAANEAMRNDGNNDQLQVGSPAPAPEPTNDRAAEVGTSAQRKYREARDRFNREMVDHGQFQVNDNDFDGVDDPALALDLRSLKAALVRGDDLEADEAADRLHYALAQRYPDVEAPAIPDEGDFDPEVKAQRALREALDRYNAEIHSDALEWVAEANEPDVDWSLWGLSDAQGAVFADALNERTARLGAAIQDGVSAAADRAAARLRQLFVETGVRPDHDFNSLPTIEEFREQGRVLRPAPARRNNPLLTGGSSHSERLAQLEQAVATGVWGEEELGQGAMGETKKQLLNDGTTVINKRAKGTWPYGGVDWTAIQQTDAEELSALVGSALGLRSPAVQRVDDTTINMEFVPDATPAFNRYWDRDATDFLRVPGDVLGSDDGLRMGLLDVLIGNPDRHGYNWMVDDDNRLYPIDNGLAFVNLKGTNASDAGRSPFAAEYFITPDGRFKDNILSRRDIQWVREQMEALAPQFQRVGQPAWYTQIQNRLRQLEIRARGGNQHQLPAPQGEVRPE